MFRECDVCAISRGWARGQHDRNWRPCRRGTVACQSCSGSGTSDSDELVACKACGGHGYVTCRKCHGTGMTLGGPYSTAA